LRIFGDDRLRGLGVARGTTSGFPTYLRCRTVLVVITHASDQRSRFKNVASLQGGLSTNVLLWYVRGGLIQQVNFFELHSVLATLRSCIFLDLGRSVKGGASPQVFFQTCAISE